MKTVAVVTATTGRAELQQAIDSIARQSYPCKHYIFFDGVTPSPDLGYSFDTRIIELPVKTGGNGLMNAGICAASAYLVQEDMICWLDDDNWFEEEHIEELVKAKGENAVAHSLRNLVNPDGSFWAQDNFESIGTYGELVDVNCYLMDRKLATGIAPLWYQTTGELMIGDRYIFNYLKQQNMIHAASGLYTVNYRLNPNRDLRPFFFQGNIQTRAKYPDGYPWTRHEV